MNRRELEQRTKRFALEIIDFTDHLPRRRSSGVMGNQLLRAGTAIGALYREAARAESRADFIHKLSLATKEAAETEYWLELFVERRLGDESRLAELRREIDELLRILLASLKTAKSRK